MKNQSGFTLIEILFVLSIFLIITSISGLLIRPHYLVMEREQFISQFKADFLYSQQYAISQQKNLVFFILPKDKRYYVKEKSSSVYLVDRLIPKTIKVEDGTMGTASSIQLELNPSGHINRFGTVYFYVRDQKYKMIFQIGAGRFYVLKE
jgi:competence protein ComGD